MTVFFSKYEKNGEYYYPSIMVVFENYTEQKYEEVQYVSVFGQKLHVQQFKVDGTQKDYVLENVRYFVVDK